MTLMRIRGLSKHFGNKEVLKDLNFDINERDIIGLVGYNGTGKTTLANMLFGNIKADKGSIETLNGSLKIGYLLQSIDYSINDFQDIYTQLENKEILFHTSQLGLQKLTDWDTERMEHLSGGEKLKLSLAQVWASKPDMLILDEPTNHLDQTGVKWLISQLKSFHGPIIIISHDRYFLDQTVNKIFEIEDCQLSKFNGTYTQYRADKRKRREVQEHQYIVQQRYKEEIETQMSNLRQWSDKGHRDSTKKDPSGNKLGMKEYHRMKAKKRDNQIKSKMKRLEAELEKNRIEKPKEETTVKFEFDSEGKRGKRIIEAKNITKCFGSNTIFSNTNFYIKHGERVGIIGENGAGKTTLIKILLGDELLSAGELWSSQSLKIAYLSQDVHDLRGEQSILEALQVSEWSDVNKAKNILANLGLKGERLSQRIKSLSLGERIRVKLTDILLKEYDVLILDEPTNHLDLPSREQLEETLLQFTGTILFVSHDRYFLNKISDKLLVFDNKKIKRMESGFQEFSSKKDSKDHQSLKINQKFIEEELMLIDNQITAVLGQLSSLVPGDEKYQQLDQQFKELMQKKKAMGV